MGTFGGKMRGAEMLHIRNIHNVSASHGRDLISHTLSGGVTECPKE